MDITLLNTADENNKLDKSFAANRLEISGALVVESSVISPMLRIQAANISTFNYAFISSFGRYYFITDIVSVNNGLWIVKLRCDVLYTYRQQIRNLDVILDRTESTEENTYVSDGVWVSSVKDKTDIISFPNGLLENGEYILITAGGI